MLTLLFACFSESNTTSKWSVLVDDKSCINRVLHCGIMSMSGISNNEHIEAEAGLGECIGVVLICALLFLFERFGFLAATFVSPMMPASINAVIPSLSDAFLISALYFCKSLTISKNLEEAAGAKAFSSSQSLISTFIPSLRRAWIDFLPPSLAVPINLVACDNMAVISQADANWPFVTVMWCRLDFFADSDQRSMTISCSQDVTMFANAQNIPVLGATVRALGNNCWQDLVLVSVLARLLSQTDAIFVLFSFLCSFFDLIRSWEIGVIVRDG